MVLQPERRQVLFQGRALPFTPKEFEIMWVMAQEPGKVFRREELTELVWGEELPEGSNVIDVHVSNIRTKLRDLGGYGVMRTVRGYGYALKG
ncbi:winged helix-turn-helix domain-containing protein [Deinococcus malanensis]|uniref:winged helix-turn-helix domain-containing protein n=1 Tax=Deinococcus malanensis TaxID=1706855 RepID=UPI0027E4FC08|nr:winged helix-turn-helix domain-containing protein [Deinococcus malanensis]